MWQQEEYIAAGQHEDMQSINLNTIEGVYQCIGMRAVKRGMRDVRVRGVILNSTAPIGRRHQAPGPQAQQAGRGYKKPPEEAVCKAPLLMGGMLLGCLHTTRTHTRMCTAANLNQPCTIPPPPQPLRLASLDLRT